MLTGSSHIVAELVDNERAVRRPKEALGPILSFWLSPRNAYSRYELYSAQRSTTLLKWTCDVRRS